MPMPKTEVDFSALDALLQFKVTLAFCADYLGVSVDAIQRRIREKFDMSFTEYHKLKMERTAVKLQQKAIEQALAGNSTMMIFALKNLANWSDKNESELKIKNSIEGLSDTELKEIIARDN